MTSDLNAETIPYVARAMDQHGLPAGEKPPIDAGPVVLNYNETSKPPNAEVEKNDEQSEDSSPDYSSKAKNQSSFKNYLVMTLCPRSRALS